MKKIVKTFKGNIYFPRRHNKLRQKRIMESSWSHSRREDVILFNLLILESPSPLMRWLQWKPSAPPYPTHTLLRQDFPGDLFIPTSFSFLPLYCFLLSSSMSDSLFLSHLHLPLYHSFPWRWCVKVVGGWCVGSGVRGWGSLLDKVYAAAARGSCDVL